MTTFALEVKELPGQNPAAAPPPTNPVHNTDAPAWSGDVYQEGDESTPEQSQWSFTGDGGEEAWLDRSADGTITGWVRDPDGTVYRYTDPDAWAVDVDDAGLAPSGGGDVAEGEPVEGEDPNAADDPTQGDDYADEDQSDVDEDAAYDDYVNGDPEDPDAEGEGDEPADDELDEDPAEESTETPDEEATEDAEEPDAADDEGDDEQDGPPFGKKKGKVEAKVYRLPYV